MTILAGDIKLVKSEVMDDVPEGGGAPTANVIADNESNAIFADISELDRAGGDVSLRKIFLTVQTDNRDTYLGSNVIIAKKPEDPLVSLTLFGGTSGNMFDKRTDAQDRIESYLAAGPEWSGFLLENHITGQASIRLFQRVGSTTPTIGSTMILVYNEGLSTERIQYVRIADVSEEVQQFTHMNGSTPEEYDALVVTCDLTDALRLDFPGSPPARNFTRTTSGSGSTKVRSTVVANAAKYYGVADLVEALAIDDISAKASSIFTQLVPSAQTEIPLLDQNAAGNADAIIDSASGTVSYSTSQLIGSGTALNLGNPITPGTLVITVSGGELTDSGGQLYAGAEVVGTVDYPRGTVTLVSGAPSYTGTKTVTFKPAAAPLVVADTAQIPVTIETRSFNYGLTILPAPSPGTLRVSYRSNGRWYDLYDNGSGALKGIDAAFGVGTISYITGTILVTLGALPDVDTAIMYAWGASPNYINRSDMDVPPPKVKFQLENGGVAPNSVTITWNDGTARTATDDGDGNITGDATGTIRYKTGDIELTLANLPLGGQEFDVDYAWDTPFSENFINPGASFTLAEEDITPGTVEITWALLAPSVNYGGVQYPFAATRTAKDDGAGAIKLNGTTVGSINYSTGAITGFDFSVNAMVPEIAYGWRWTNIGYAYVPVGVVYVEKECLQNLATPVVAEYRAATADTTETDEGHAPGNIKLDLTDEFAELIVPGSVNFALGGRRYFDRSGSLYYGLEVTTGAATLGGSINYMTGEVTLTSWASGQPSTVALNSLLTTLDDRPVTQVTFRVPIAPVRPSSLQILATKVAGGTINVSANNDGDIIGTGISGHIDYQTGVVYVNFGTMVTAAGNEGEEWYDPDNVEGGMIFRPEPVFAETVRYNAIAFTYLPLDADILGLDPVRLPQDGRVPIFEVGRFVVIGHTDETAPATVAADDEIDCGRVRLSRVRLIGNDGNTIITGYTVDLDAGIVTVVDPTGWSQPVKVEHRIEDMLQVSDVQINGDMSFTRPVTHVYPVPGSTISSALVTNDLKSRVSLIFDQATWNGIDWLDAVSGSPATATYNNLAGPIEVTNIGAVTERWALKFLTSTTGQIIGEHVGVIGEFSINTVTSPTNPATDEPYFTIPTEGWGIGWSVGNIVRFNTVGAIVPLWLIRTVQQGPETTDNHSFTLLARGDVDAP